MEMRSIILFIIYCTFGVSVIYAVHLKRLESSSEYLEDYKKKGFFSKAFTHTGFLTGSLLIGLVLGFFLNAIAVSENILPLTSDDKKVSVNNDSETHYYTFLQFTKKLTDDVDDAIK